MPKICPECGDPVVQRRPIRDLIGVPPERMVYSHKGDGEPLCPEYIVDLGAVPSLPKEA